MKQAGVDAVAGLGRSLRRWRIFAFFFAAVAVILGHDEPLRWVREHSRQLGLLQVNPKAPHAREVAKVLRGLRYSGLATLLRPDFRISVDFKNQIWTAHNIHRFNETGEVVLEQGNFGLCGDLAEHTYQQIRPIFSSAYPIEFVKVAEAQFFPASLSAHYVLRITHAAPPAPPAVHILDPSFGRYGPMEDFEDYLFYGADSRMAFARQKRRDEAFPVGHGTPVLMDSKVLLGLFIGRDGRRFDPDHYRLSLVANWRYRYAGRSLLTIRRRGDLTEVIENPKLIRKAMRRQDYERLKRRLIDVFNKITPEDAQASAGQAVQFRTID